VEQGTGGEDIADNLDVLLVPHADDFGGNVPGSAAAVEVVGLLVADGCQSEVDQHWLPAVWGPQHHVLELDVPVHDSEAVHVDQGLEQPAHDFLGLVGSDSAVPVDPFEEVAASEVFGDHED